MMSRPRARASVFLLTLALGCTISAAPALASRSLPASTRLPVSSALAASSSQAASGWLARQMTGGSHFVEVFGGVTYPAQGETIDAILAFAAAKSANGFGARAIGWLKRPGVLTGYIGNGSSESYAGATAKLALAAEVRGINPARFGKVNLIKRLASLLTVSGRYSDHSAYGDFSNAFSQSLAIIAMSRRGGAPAKAVQFLVSSECKNGGFPLDFAQPTCTSDTDATAMDVQALLAAGRQTPAARGLHWLATVQKTDGGLAAAGAKLPNANTTGLAGEAFAAAHWRGHAAAAKKFLLSLQVGCTTARPSRQGAIAYDSAGFVHSTAVDATAQGILGLADISLVNLSSRGSLNGDPRLTCTA